ncbi:electron transfer flavoprotein subunit alpha/FixB family protein [Desulfobotulus sp.]|jgi:electron transfer flavoprotein alpha subunit|uniref:electron transfer flavoprotein subunit alpha/FixB family protein n=1 Tax=Desulfobotulus sp. TaxID=1940337 RepID=UPI002A35BDD6|nr:electron transfer flavoprotein subunit alpha/FixB family protein [Desulfobotulus sp.]MDY0163443.1 electron transfer flavoprotein subunit alpha/FixB family protein [Desulfobotulus sp.]
MTDTKDFSDYKGVWVFIEQQEGNLTRTTLSLEMLGEGRKLADKLGAPLTAFLLGHNVGKLAEELILYGADIVLLADHPALAEYRTGHYTDIICKEALERKPDVLLVGASPVGRDLAPRISFRLHTGCTADCTLLDIDEEKKILVSTRPAFGGNVMATILCPDHRPQMSTVRPGVMDMPVKDTARKGEVVTLNLSIDEAADPVKVLSVKKREHSGINIREAERVVCVGMGAGDTQTFARLEELAKELDAQVGGTRPVVEACLITHDCQIGQTGKTIRPELYLAVGVSGTVQHTTGMSEAKTIVAINKDAKAEIFNFAHYGIVGDASKIVPALIDQIRKAKAAR